MKNKLVFAGSFLWTSLIAFTLPICSAWIFMDITGHGKGYGYDLGDEKDLYILFGFVELVLWLILALPSGIALFHRLNTGRKRILCSLFLAALFMLCVQLIGGWAEYAGTFHL